jgi:hypothetical protein
MEESNWVLEKVVGEEHCNVYFSPDIIRMMK